MKSAFLAIAISLAFLTFSIDADARSSKAGARPYYGGGKHTYSHGGNYQGGRGSSHKGGTYRNPGSGDRYGRH